MTPDWISDDGSVQLYCGDCLQVLPTLSGVDAVVTDPPYPKLTGGHRRDFSGGVCERRATTESVGLPWGGSLAWTESAWNASRFGAVVFCSYHSVADVRAAFGNAKPMCLLTWYKRNSPPTGKNLPRYTTEFAWGFNKSPGLKWDALKTTMFDIPSLPAGCMAVERVLNEDGTTAHPTQKPVRLIEEILAIDPESVLDPFMGSGTTGVACVKTGRKFIGIELDPGYFEIAKKRIQKAIAEKSELLIA